jgi:hypothetical protein
VKRTKRRGLLRNVAVALGNWGSPEAVPVLAGSLHGTPRGPPPCSHSARKPCRTVERSIPRRRRSDPPDRDRVERLAGRSLPSPVA